MLGDFSGARDAYKFIIHGNHNPKICKAPCFDTATQTLAENKMELAAAKMRRILAAEPGTYMLDGTLAPPLGAQWTAPPPLAGRGAHTDRTKAQTPVQAPRDPWAVKEKWVSGNAAIQKMLDKMETDTERWSL